MDVPGAVPAGTVLDDRMVEISADDGSVPAYVVSTAGGEAAAIIVLHEAMGLNDHIRDVTRRFANVGYLAVAPDLYHRVGAPAETEMDDVLARMFSLPDAGVVRDVVATADWVRIQLPAGGRVGLVGFCAGGRWTLLVASTTSAVDAAVDCWGGFLESATFDEVTTEARPDRVIDNVAGLRVPVLAVGGERDTNPSPEDLRELERQFAALPQEARVRLFNDAGHAFFADYRAGYQPDAAHALWAEMLDFFGRHLEGPISPPS